MSGFELLGALRERGIGLPVVFLTGYSLVELELQALDHGAIDFVDKARGIEVLAHRLRVILEGQRHMPAPAMPEVERHGELALYPSTARALWQQRDTGLTVTEYKIVRLLVSGTGIQSYRTIYDTAHYAGFVAGSGALGYTINVRSLIKRIWRKFLAVDPGFSRSRTCTVSATDGSIHSTDGSGRSRAQGSSATQASVRQRHWGMSRFDGGSPVHIVGGR